MKFQVVFKCDGAGEYPVNQAQTQIGLSIVDQARTFLGGSFPIEDFETEIRGNKTLVIANVSESLARSSGIFSQVNRIEISVSDGALNQYAPMLAEIVEGKPIVRYSQNALQAATDWFNQGRPNPWTPNNN